MRVYKYIILHFLILAIFYLASRLLLSLPVFPSQYALTTIWDAMHYYIIKTNGYFFDPNVQSNVAFFPGFPYLWKYTGLNAFGISALNLVIFAGSTGVLARFFRLNIKELMLVLSLPSMFFMYIPYSEALFFATSVLLLIGLAKMNDGLTVGGFLTSTFIRSAANVFLPAVIITELLTPGRKLKNILLYCGATVLSVVIVIAIQHAQTGAWFGYFQTQKHWGHHLSIPHIPFYTWGDFRALDGAALVFGLICGLLVIRYLVRFFRYKELVDNRAYLFSLLYIGGLTLFALLYKGGGLFSLNRYLIPTAFFVLVFKYFLRTRLSGMQLLYLFLGMVAFFTVFFSTWMHIKPFSAFLLLCAYLLLYSQVNAENKYVSNVSFLLLYIANLAIQVYLLSVFFNHHWVG